MTRIPSVFMVACLTLVAAHAEAITHWVDSAESQLTAEVTVIGTPLSPQGAGADVDSYWGGIQVDFVTSAVLTFPGGDSSGANAALNPAEPFDPAVGVAETMGLLDNYGFSGMVNIPGLGMMPVNAAVRDVVLDITGGPLTAGSSADVLNIVAISGLIDAEIPGIQVGSLSFAGQSIPNSPSANVVLVSNGPLTTVTIPIEATYDVESDGMTGSARVHGNLVVFNLPGDSNGDRKVDLTDLGILATNWGRTDLTELWQLSGDADEDGNVNLSDLGILATNWGYGTQGTVPEPATVSLLALGAMALLRRR